MKKLNKIGIAFICLIMGACFSACNDDDEYLGKKDSPFYGKKLVGQWEISWSKGQDIQGGEKVEWDKADDGFFLVFNEDRSGYNYHQGDSIKNYFIWKIEENQLAIKKQGQQKFDLGTIDNLTDQELVITLDLGNFKDTETYKKVAMNDSIPVTEPKK